jgi:hypothetical protein
MGRGVANIDAARGTRVRARLRIFWRQCRSPGRRPVSRIDLTKFAIDDGTALIGWGAELASRYMHGETPQDGPPYQRAQRRQQQKKTDCVCQEAGGQQERSSRQEADPVKRLFERLFASREGLLGAGQCAQPLSADEGATRHGGQDHKRNGRPDADLATDDHEQCDFSGRDADKQEEKHHTKQLICTFLNENHLCGDEGRQALPVLDLCRALSLF